MSVYSVNVYPSSTTIKKGNWYYGAYARVDASSNCNTDVTWYSNNTSVATVNASSGYIYAKAEGTARIYAQSTIDSSKKDYITVTVTSGTICVESVRLNRYSISLEKGDTFDLCATVCPTNATNKTICWGSSNTGVATVSGGVVTAKARGYAYIYAEAQDGSGVYNSCYVNVTEDILVTSVSASWSRTSIVSNKTLTIGKTAYVYETVCPTNATNKCVKWTSDKPHIAFVNPESGLVIAQGTGTATITATACDGSNKKGYCTITVDAPVTVTSVEVCPETETLNVGETCCLCADVYPSNANNQTIRWYSSDTKVATVDLNTGHVTAKSAGKAAIYARAQDGSGVSDYCCITVKQNSSKPEEDTGTTQVPEKTVQDPVDVYTGAHLIKNSIMTLFGGQGLKLTANYDSTRLSSGIFGIGWYHNFEKHLEMVDCEAHVYSGPSTYSRYSSNDDCTVYTCTAANKNGYVLTVDNCADSVGKRLKL